MKLKFFIEANRKRPDEMGKLCRILLSDSLINWHGSKYDQLRRVTEYRKKFGQPVLDEFFNEFKDAEYERR